MLLQMKVYLISSLYFFGALFIILFPPRNFQQLSVKLLAYISSNFRFAMSNNLDIKNWTGSKARTMRSTGGELNYQQYLNHETLLSACKRLADDNPDLVRMMYLPPCTENNRTLLSLELRSDKESKKPGIFIVGAINAMAWGSANAILELAERLIYDANYQSPFFNDYDWYLIPMGNPDGVEYTQKMQLKPSLDVKAWSRNLTARETTRPSFWFKNQDSPGQEGKVTCAGTNINRNFAYHWQDDVHKTPDQCSQFYPGTKPFSTHEAQAIRGYIDRLGDDINLAIHLHSSFTHKKEFILYPWRYSLRQPSNYGTLQSVGEYAARHSRLPDGRLFQVHQSSNDERVAGSLSDYVTGVVGIELAFLIKPYHDLYPNTTDHTALEVYVKKSISAILGLVRGWRSSTKLNTLSFFGRDVEF